MNFRIPLFLFLLAWTVATVRAQQSILLKADTTTMNGAADWGGTAPGAGRIGQFGATISAAKEAGLALGGNVTLDALTFSGTLNGSVTIASGSTLTLGAASGTSGILMDAANQDVTLNCSVALAANNTWSVASGRTLTIGNSISGTALLTVSGSGVVTFNGNSTYIFGTTGTGNNAFALNGGTVNCKSGTMTFNSNSNANNAAMINGNSSFNVQGGTVNSSYYTRLGSGAAGTFSAINVSGGAFNNAGSILFGFGGTGGNGTLTLTNTGIVNAHFLRLGDTSVSGTHTVNLDGGTLTADRVFRNNATPVFNFNGGLLQVNSAPFSPWFAASVSNVWVKNGGALIDTNGQDVTLEPGLQSFAGSTGGLTKLGLGALTLTGTSTYTGATSVLAGTLAVNGLLSGTGTVTVASGGTLSGTGTLNAPVVVSNGGTLAPGSGTLTTGNLTLGSSATLALSLGSGSSATDSHIAVNGNLTLDGSLLVIDSGTVSAGSIYSAITYTGTLVNHGVTDAAASSWMVALDTSVPHLVKVTATHLAPDIEITTGNQAVTATSLTINGIFHRVMTGAAWYEVRDQTGKLWDFGATIARPSWSIGVRHLRPGTNTVTVYARDAAGIVYSANVQLTMTLGATPAVRPRPIPAEIWWGGLSDNSGMTNYDQWPFVQKYEDGYFFHSAGWGSATTALQQSLATNLLASNTKYWTELGGDQGGFGISGSTAAHQVLQWGNWAAAREANGIIWSEFTHDYHSENMQDVCQVNPTWSYNDQIAWWTGDLSIASGTFPYASGIWGDVFTGYYARFPHVKIGHTSQPEYFSWDTYPALLGNSLSFTVTNPTTSFAFNNHDIMASFVNMAAAIGHPYFSLQSDAPWEYFGEPTSSFTTPAAQAVMREKIRVYEAYLQSRGSRHTLICNSSSAASVAGGDLAQNLYYEQNSLKSMALHQQEGGRANRYLFEGWYAGIPHSVVPETESGSYTHLALSAIKYLKGIADINGTPEPLTMSLSTSGSGGTLTVTNGGDVTCMPAITASETGPGNTFTSYFYNGTDITSQILSDEGFVLTSQLAPGATATITMRPYVVGVMPPNSQRSVTFEAFWNPQDPTGIVRDRKVGAWSSPPVAVRAVASTLLVDLRGTDPSASGTSWTNLGTLGSAFAKVGTPALATNVLGTGIPGVQFNGTDQAYQGPNSSSTIDGAGNRSIEVWAWNPALVSEETMVSWGHRGSTRQNMAFNFGSNAAYGAAAHYGDDVSWGGSPPSAGAWHHLVYTYASSVVNIYVDGALANTQTLGGALNTFASEPINLGCQRNSANGTRSLFFGGYLNSVRVHSAVLTASNVTLNYLIGPWVSNLCLWREAVFPGSTATSGPGADSATPFSDGVPNLVKFATGMDPSKPGTMPGSASVSGTNLLFTYTPTALAVADGVTFTVEYSDTLAAGSWQSGIVNQGTIGSGGVPVTASVPKGSSGRRFLRLRITPAP